MKKPLVSVIVPVYNVKNYLNACLDSLENQTYSNLEIILVDDGSDDGSAEMLDEYALVDARAKVFHNKNGGLSSARNFGLQKATGEYVTFLDSDDYFEKDAIFYLYDLISEQGASISVASHYEREKNKDLKDFNTTGARTDGLTVKEALFNMLNERGFMMSAWGKLYSRELFNGIRFPEGKLHEDVGTTYKLFLAAYSKNKNATIAYGAKPVYIYNIRGSSITNAGFDPRKEALISQTDEMCDEIFKIFPELSDTLNLRRVHARFSVLRQIVGEKKTDAKGKLEQRLVEYIKAHKDWVLKNPVASRRDKIAVYSLMMGKLTFKLSWKIYKALR